MAVVYDNVIHTTDIHSMYHQRCKLWLYYFVVIKVANIDKIIALGGLTRDLVPDSFCKLPWLQG